MSIRALIRVTFCVVMAAAAAYGETGFLNRTVTVGDTAYRYVVYVPADWTAQKKWPIILALHGSIERGDDGASQSYVGLGHAVRKHPERYPAVIVMPQCRKNDGWGSPSMEAQALAALEAATKEFNGDRERTYLTGFSMGGYGTWTIAGNHRSRFAALIVVCGGIVWPPPEPEPDPQDNPYARAARRVAGIPVWVFHGDADRNVLVTESRRTVAALKELHAEVKYTEYKGAAHFIWDTVYEDAETSSWLLRQGRKSVATEESIEASRQTK